MRERLSICMCAFPLGFGDEMWNLIIFVPNDCLSVYSDLFCSLLCNVRNIIVKLWIPETITLKAAFIPYQVRTVP